MARSYYPDFLRTYQCKCGECRRTCCQDDWVIGLSKEEFLADRDNNLGPELHALATKNLQRIKESQDENLYARCAIRDDGFCSMYTDDGLCAWHLLRGESVGAVCNEFPLLHIAWTGDEYTFPTAACEAVVEALMRQDAPIRLKEEPLDTPARTLHLEIKPEHFKSRPLLRYYPDLIRMCAATLQNRDYTLDERMTLLANSMNMISWIEQTGKTADMPEVIGSCLDKSNLKTTWNRYRPFDVSPGAVLTLIYHMTIPHLRFPHFREPARRILEGLGFEVQESQSEKGPQYNVNLTCKEAFSERKKALSGFMQEKAGFFENLLVCEMYRSMVPISGTDPFGSFALLNAWYALLKGTVYGFFSSPPGDRELADAIVLLQRMYPHQQGGYDRAIRIMQREGLSDLPAMVALAKG